MTGPIKNLLPEKRDAKGFTQMALAIEAKMTPTQLGEYENGIRFPRPGAIAAIAGVLQEQPATVYEWLTTPATADATEPVSEPQEAASR